jgi:hypothetical protein
MAKEPKAERSKVVAKWMWAQLKKNHGYLEHYPVIRHLQDTDKDLVYMNRSGGWAIDPAVLAAFRKLTEGEVVWSRGELRWRRRNKYDNPAKRLTD